MTRVISARLYIAWDGANYIDESSRLISARCQARLTPPTVIGVSSRGQVDRCDLELDNRDGRYSPLNSSGALYAFLQNGGAYHRPMYLEASTTSPASYARIFTGVIKLPNESTPTPRSTGAISIDCRSMDELLLQRRTSTQLADMQDWNASGLREGEMISALLGIMSIGGDHIDAGLFQIPFGWLDDESPLEEIWAIAGACGGRFYADPDGALCYEDMFHWLRSPHDTVQETLTRADFQSLDATFSDADLYNEVKVETSPRTVAAPDNIWEPDEMVIVPPTKTVNITARFKQAAWTVSAPVFRASDGSGNDITDDVTIVPEIYVQRAELAITNANTTKTAYLSPLTISGKPLTGGPTQEESRNSNDHGSNQAWWTARDTHRIRSVRGNPYIQTQAHAATVALYLLQRSEAPRLLFRLGGVPGKATRRCGDRITINDTAIMSSAHTAVITAITSTYSGNAGFTQDLEAVDVTALYPYAGSYFIIGTNKPGTGTGSARMFY